MTIIEKLKQTKFTKTEQDVGNYMISNPSKIINMSIQELTDKTYSSNVTIMRICKKIGLKGFSNLKINLAKEASNFSSIDKNIEANVPFGCNANKKEIADTILALHQQVLTEIYDAIDF